MRPLHQLRLYYVGLNLFFKAYLHQLYASLNLFFTAYLHQLYAGLKMSLYDTLTHMRKGKVKFGFTWLKCVVTLHKRELYASYTPPLR